jgi:hypothetical protein
MIQTLTYHGSIVKVGGNEIQGSDTNKDTAAVNAINGLDDASDFN